MRSKTIWWVIGTMALVGIICTALAVYAQPPAAPGAPPGAGAPGGGGRGGFGGPGGGGRGMGLMGMMAGAPTAITVANGKLYIVYLGTLFKFNADTLEEEGQVRLKPEWIPAEAFAMPAGGPPGGGPPPGAPPAPAPGAPAQAPGAPPAH